MADTDEGKGNPTPKDSRAEGDQVLSVSYTGKNAYSANKTSGVLRGCASGTNRCYVLAHCVGVGGQVEEKNGDGNSGNYVVATRLC